MELHTLQFIYFLNKQIFGVKESRRQNLTILSAGLRQLKAHLQTVRTKTRNVKITSNALPSRSYKNFIRVCFNEHIFEIHFNDERQI